MLFNSYGFLAFFPLITSLYWAIKIIGGADSLKIRNMLLLVGSYYFYMCWQPKYALLLLFSTVVTYVAALWINRREKHKKLWLTVAIILNLAILFFYKYYGFVADSITELLCAFGIAINIPEFDVLLPVGISFYIFQALGYSIDVYRGAIKPEKNFFTYALFVSFFPQLVAGPIERSTNLLKQFKEDHEFNYDFAISGFKLMLWGYAMKLCLADRASVYVDAVFSNISCHEGYSTLIATILFTLQIYGDFAGYTFIAIGCARILGFSLNDNFCRPYFATTITDFWRRWHISLSTWLRDYIYFPLGGSRTTKAKTYRNLLITFGVSGLWHGANWHFVVWGFLHGIAMCIERFLGFHKKQWHGFLKLVHIVLTLVVVNFAWMLFRANTIDDAYIAFLQILSPSDFSLQTGKSWLIFSLFAALIFFVKEVCDEYKINLFRQNIIVSNYLLPIALLFYIGFCGVIDGGQFIYFQF